MAKSMIIIGAGIGGLSTGCYAQMNGYDTRILEMHDKPGGVCTSWRRKGYLFDSCIHHLGGSGPQSALYGMWQEMGALQGRPVLFPADLVQVEGANGERFTVYTDLDRLEQHMNEIAPADVQVTKAYIDAARRMTHGDIFAAQLGEPKHLLAVAPLVPTVAKWGKINLETYAQRFSDPFLRSAFPWIQYAFANIPTVVNLIFLAGCHRRILGWPVGGSLAFAEGIARRYESLGGQVQYRARVERILVENDRAVGVRLADGAEQRADLVVSNADGYATIYGMLDGRYVNEAINRYYAAVPEHQEMSLHVFLGVARDLSGEPHAITRLLDQPMEIADRQVARLDLELFTAETGAAPAGKGVIKVPLDAGYAYWKGLRSDLSRYREAKERVAETVITQVERRFPGIRSQIEVIDVSTPITIERYTNSYHGWQAWGRPDAGMTGMFRGLSKTLPGLANFHMVGQWAGATIGITTAAVMGRNLVRGLCKREHRRFVTTAPEA